MTSDVSGNSSLKVEVKQVNDRKISLYSYSYLQKAKSQVYYNVSYTNRPIPLETLEIAIICHLGTIHLSYFCNLQKLSNYGNNKKVYLEKENTYNKGLKKV